MVAALTNLHGRPTRRRLTWAALALGCWLVSGCAEPEFEAATDADAAVATPITPVSLPPEQKPAPSATSGPAASEAPTTAVALPPDKSLNDSAAGDYQPPFPGRVELFVLPKRVGGEPTTAGAEANSVELIGFVRVDRQRAVLSIDGNVAPIAAGETQFGVEVLSIDPPKVELQRGSQRWQATLE